VRTYKLVKANGPDDLVFQSVKDGKPMRDNNILKRFIKPAARKLGVPFVNWRCLRTLHATWLVQAGADPKSVQGQMRHTRISTTMDIYAQIVPEAQRRAVKKLSRSPKLLSQMLSHYWSNKTMLKVIEIGAKSNTISHMTAADAIVRNDEVVGSIPTSSTKFSITCKPFVAQPCHTLSHKIWLGAYGVRLRATIGQTFFRRP
jgi:hypothetical protein